MANRMVLFANFIALAEEQGHRVLNPTFHSYATLFQSTLHDIYCQYPSPTRRSWLDRLPLVPNAIRGTRLFFRVARPVSLLNERFPSSRRVVTLRQTPGQQITALDGPEVQGKIRDARIVLVNGWNFRAPHLVQRYARKIRDYFRPMQRFEEASESSVYKIRKSSDIVVGVHLRRGDYSGWRGGQCFFSVAQYAQWMHDLAGQLDKRKTSFLVCSDEPRQEQEFPGLSVGFGPGSPIDDLYALAKCDYIFGPISTFSQWASFYGGKPLLHLYDRDTPVELGRFKVSDLKEVP